MPEQRSNPLEPLTAIAKLTSWLVYVLALLAVMLVLFGPGGLVSGGGLRTACVDSAGTLSTTGITDPFPVREGVRVSSASADVCLDEPATGLWLASTAQRWVWLLWCAGAVLLLMRFLRAAALEGPYADSVPRRLRVLGWYLPAAAVATAALAGMARATLLNGMFETEVSWTALWSAEFPLWTLFAGAAALTLARILSLGTRMREDLEGTV